MEAIRPSLAALRLNAPRRARPLYQCLHTSSSRYAQPLPQPSVPGPPPEAPKPSSSDALERVQRKRKQAELLKQASDIRKSSDPKYTSALAKRFWKEVSVKETDDGLQVFLDQRPVRTPNKEILTVPSSKPQLATSIAIEWDLLVSAQQALKTHYIPMTSLAARAVDIQRADSAGQNKIREDVTKMFLRYLDTDTLLCWAPEKSLHDPDNTGSLRDLQMDISTPIIAYLTTHVWPGVEIKPILDPDSIIPVEQPQETVEVIKSWLNTIPAFEFAGLERAVLASKSFLIGARLIHEWGEFFADSKKPIQAQRFGIEEAAEAASTEVRWQTRQWGEVEDTHDVEKEDMKRQLGSVVLLVGGNNA